MGRRNFLANRVGGRKRPNIIHLVPHDFGRTAACLGWPDVRTPNLDRLAAGGILFTNHFQASSPCSPGRGTIMTGKYAHSNGLIGLENKGFALPTEQRTIVDYLNDAGFKTFHSGHQHERRTAEELHYGEILGPRQGRASWYCDTVCDTLADFIRTRAAGEGPFYFNAGFWECHAAWDRPEYQGRFDPAQLRVPGWLSDNDDTRTELARFYGAVEFMDECIGRVLDALDETGQSENTLVLFNTDHGISFVRAKGSMYDPGITTALMMRWPGVIEPGTRCGHLLSSVDWLPSLLDLLGIEAGADIQGHSFAPVLRGETYEPREAIFAEYNFHEEFDPIRTVRTDRWKYIRNLSERCRILLPSENPGQGKYGQRWITDKPRPWEELFDLEADPLELNNLAGDPAHEAVLNEMRARLNTWMKETHDFVRGAFEFIYRPANDRRYIPLAPGNTAAAKQ